MNNSSEYSTKTIFTEENQNSLNQNFSLLESQPTVHVSLINKFLSHYETIQLFRSSHRLYSIPLRIPILLNYFNENAELQKSFHFNNFLSSTFQLKLFSFRFFISGIQISNEEEFYEWRKIISSHENQNLNMKKIFSRLNRLELELNFEEFILPQIPVREFIPSTVK